MAEALKQRHRAPSPSNEGLPIGTASKGRRPSKPYSLAPTNPWQAYASSVSIFGLVAALISILLIYFTLHTRSMQPTDGRHAVINSIQNSEYTPSLKKDIDALIEEATRVSRELGIITETDAAEEERLVALGISLDATANNNTNNNDTPSSFSGCTSHQECLPHGECLHNRCSCTAAFTGRYCGHAIALTWPFLTHYMTNFSLLYHGEFVLYRGIPQDELRVALGFKADYKLDKEELESMLQYLPLEDPLLKGGIYNTCAVVGPSAFLLTQQQGNSIDTHQLVVRTDTSPLVGFEQYVGSKTTVRLANFALSSQLPLSNNANISNSTKEFVTGVDTSEKSETATTTAEQKAIRAKEGRPLLWSGIHTSVATFLLKHALNNNPSTHTDTDIDDSIQPVLLMHSAFVEYVEANFGFQPGSNLYAVMLALHVCREVVVYGMVQLPHIQGQSIQPHGPYESPCLRTTNSLFAPNAALTVQEQQVVNVLFESGLFHLGDVCGLECLKEEESCRQCFVDKGIELEGIDELKCVEEQQEEVTTL